MLVLGIESSCDETGVALYDTQAGLLAQALHSQAAMHERYGGVVPELASRDHVERLTPLLEGVLAEAGRPLTAIDAIAYTQGPGLAGALLVGASVATALAFSLDRPVIGIHHLEGHLLSPLLADDPPEFPFVALLVSGGHTQLLRVDGLGHYWSQYNSQAKLPASIEEPGSVSVVSWPMASTPRLWWRNSKASIDQPGQLRLPSSSMP